MKLTCSLPLTILCALLTSTSVHGAAANVGGWEKVQQLSASPAGMCMFENLVVSPLQTMPAQGNVPVQATGVNVYAQQSDSTYVLQQVLGQELMVTDCAISSSYIVLTVFTQVNDRPVYTMYFFQQQGSSLQWEQSQTITEEWDQTNGIIRSSIHIADTYLALTNQFPSPVNTGTVSLYSATSGQWSQVQQITNQVSDSSIPLVVSLYANRLVVTGFPGVKSNATSSTTIFNAGSGNTFNFESEMDTVCAFPTLGLGNLLASSTKNGVDLYKLDEASSAFVLLDSVASGATVVENRGTTSLQMSPDSTFIVRGLGPYDYSSSTGCVVYSIVGGKVAMSYDSYGSSPLTTRCMVGGGVFGMAIVDTASYGKVYIDVYAQK